MYNFSIRKFYETGTGNGAGPSLADFDKEPPAENPTPLIQPVKSEADLAEEANKQAAEAAAAEYTKLEAEAKNEDGTLKPGYRMNAENKVEVDPDYKPEEEAEEEDAQDPEAFWADVDKLRGRKLEVKYPDGVDPLSPEGVHIREKAVAEEAVVMFERSLQQKDPRSYAYMLHRQRGGTDETFFSEKSFSLPSYETFSNDADLQMSVYKNSLISKGLSEEVAQMAVDQAVKNGKLFAESDIAYKKLVEADQKVLQSTQQLAQQAEREYQQVVEKSTRQLTQFIDEGKGMNFIIPDTDKLPFKAFVQERMEYDANTKEILLVERFGGDDAARKLEALFLLYKKGDLKGLIKREAQTQNTRRLGQRVKAANASPGSSSENKKDQTEFVPLGSL